MKFESAYSCMSFSTSRDVYVNNTLKTYRISTHGYQSIKSNTCIRYKSISHDPDNNIHYLRNEPGRPFKYRHEDENHEIIYHQYGHSCNNIKRNMITIIRDPKARLISAVLDSFHHEGMTVADFKNLTMHLSKIDDEAHHYKDRTLRKLQYIATLPDFYGCQVKMLNGVPCTSKLLVSNGFNQTALDFAIQRLKQYLFVGIFERYVDTINMLHFYAGGSTKPHYIELIKLRTTDNNISSYIKDRLEFNDPYDSKLYEVALNIFNEKYKFYKKMINNT